MCSDAAFNSHHRCHISQPDSGCAWRQDRCDPTNHLPISRMSPSHPQPTGHLPMPPPPVPLPVASRPGCYHSFATCLPQPTQSPAGRHSLPDSAHAAEQPAGTPSSDEAWFQSIGYVRMPAPATPSRGSGTRSAVGTRHLAGCYRGMPPVSPDGNPVEHVARSSCSRSSSLHALIMSGNFGEWRPS